MIRESHTDTAEPLNLLDQDLDPSIVALPVPRPDTIHSPIQFIVSKNRVGSVYGMVCDLVTSTQEAAYIEIERLHDVLESTYASIPNGLKMKPISQSLLDTSDTILRRVYIAILYQKSKCVLHYKYMLLGRTDSRYVSSRSICVEAAMQNLLYQQTLTEEMAAGGRLEHDRWKISSLLNSSFILATTLVCLELDYNLSIQLTGEKAGESSDSKTIMELVQMLQASYMIWLQSSTSSREALRAAEAACLVLNKAQRVAGG
jgi:hypothetical protein